MNEFDLFLNNYSNNEKYIIDFLKRSNIILPSRMINDITKLSKHTSNEEEIYNNVCAVILKYTSNYLFPHNYISFYSVIKEKPSTKNLMCHLSNAPIKKGDAYYEFHPFIENLTNGRIFTTSKKIYSSLGYQDLFPKNISEYEDWYLKLKNCYDVDRDPTIDFYNLSVEIGEDALTLIELKLNPFEAKKRKLKREIKQLKKQLNQFIITSNEKEIVKIKKKIDLKEKKLLTQ